MNRRTVGLDVGGTKCLGVALDEHGEIVAEERRATPRGDGSLPELIDTLAELADALGPFDHIAVSYTHLDELLCEHAEWATRQLSSRAAV